MVEQIKNQILSRVKSSNYRPQKPRKLAKDLQLNSEESYGAFREALRELMHDGRVVVGQGGVVVMPTERTSRDEFTGTYRHNKRGFGFVVPLDPSAHEDLFIPPGENAGAITGDIVRAKITSRGHRDGKTMYTGRITEIVERKNKRFVGSLAKLHGQWVVQPDGNTYTEPILAPDAASRHIKVGTKVVIEITTFAEGGQWSQGVITEVLGQAGEKDVDLKSVIVQYNLPEKFPPEAEAQAREAVDTFQPEDERSSRLDLTEEIICTIDPDDAKDYDDAISLTQVEGGYWELGVHIADVSHFVEEDSPLDLEARERGNSTYFPGYVIPMLPTILSNGVCSLQEGVPRLCKSAFITLDDDARPVRTRFANTVIKSAKRLRYREAQAIIDRASEVPHPDGTTRVEDYDKNVVQLLDDMNALAKRIQKRRLMAGQLVLDLPVVDLVLSDEGKVIDAIPEDQSFTHTLIEMFMVEANEAVARLLSSLSVPFLRRTHPEPEMTDNERLRHFTTVAGYRLPKDLDRKALQALLTAVRGKPESYAINLAVLKSLTRAEYSPREIGHYALASEDYCHFTSPIRRYADLTIHRLLDAYFDATGHQFSGGGNSRSGYSKGRAKGGRKTKVVLDDVPSYESLVELGKHISFTERRSEDAEKELRQVKILELLKNQIGEEFTGVITGITNFGLFVQIQDYLIDGLIRYEDLMDDWWDVDERGGVVRGQRTGMKIHMGDLARVRIVRVDIPRRELDLAIIEMLTRGRRSNQPEEQQGKSKKPHKHNKHKAKHPLQNERGGQSRRGRNPRQQGRRRRR
jgi:ribonuclease R